MDDNLPYIGIFEDDIVLGRDAGIFLGHDQWLTERFHEAFIIKCETYLMDVSLTQSAITPLTTHHIFGTAQKTITYQFPLLNSIHYGTAGYIISQQAAKHLLKSIKTLSVSDINPIDHIMFDKSISDLPSIINTYQLTPAICVQQDCLQPSIKNTNLGSKLENERNQYRAIREQITTVSNNENSIPERGFRTSIPFEPPSTQHKNKENPIKLSIIIPIYNAEPYLAECLDSILNQTLKEIEIICINDGSPDNSASILNAYAQKDSRIVVIHKPQNEGTLLARKAGILAARGQYTTFIDPDDYYTTNQSLETIYDQIVLEGVDILMFKIKVFSDNIKLQDNFWEEHLSCQESFDGTQHLLEGLAQEKYNWTLANKIFRTELCHKAGYYIADKYCVMAEDLYIYCLVAYFARHFKGMTYEPIYSYRYGIGFSTSRVNLKRIKQDIAALTLISQELHAFSQSQQNIFPAYELFIDKIQDFLVTILIKNIHKLDKRNQQRVYKQDIAQLETHFLREIMKKQFKSPYSWETQLNLYQMLKLSTSVKKEHPIFGFFQNELNDSSFEISYILQQTLKNLGYTLKYLPISQSVNEIATPPHIDFFILYTSTINNPKYCDILVNTLIPQKKHFILIEDNTLPEFCCPITPNNYLLYVLADQVIVQSKTRQHYYQNLGINAVFLPTPIANISNSGRKLSQSCKFVWLGFADTIRKYGIEFLHVIPSILKVSEQSKFAIDSLDALTEEKRKEVLCFIHTHHLSGSIIWLKQDEILSHVQSTHLLLVTSHPLHHYEMILAAKAAGIPSVIGMETLNDTFVDLQGSVAFPCKNTNLLITAVQQLLIETDYWDNLSAEARSFVEEHYFQPEQQWSKTLSRLPYMTCKNNNLNYYKEYFTLWNNIQQLFMSNTVYPSQLIKEFQVSLYIKYKILSKITWGKRKKHYQQLFHEQLRLYDLIKNPR